jgi:hypothetical protein
MPSFVGQSGAELSAELASYLRDNQGSLTSEQITNIVNKYLSGGDKLAPQGGQITTGVYKRFGEFDRVTGKVEIVTTGIWSGDTGSLETFFTSSTQSALDYYLNVYDKDPSDSTAAIQFAVSYGHKDGSGSVSLSNSDDATLATKAIYSQYRSILLDQTDEFFTFTSSSVAATHNSDDIYIINLARARYKEKMDPGNWSITLQGSNGSFTFIDDSGKKYSDVVGKGGRVFNVVSGSLNLGTAADATIANQYAPNGQGFGLVYPDQGLIILNPAAIHSAIGQTYNSSSVLVSGPVLDQDLEYRNHYLLYSAIRDGGDFEARRTENISTSHYFVRATNREFNFSNNPTFISGSDGSFRNRSFEDDPKTYVTTVGLLNDANEILAVAKTSQPIVKSFDREVLIKVKLSF